MRGGLSEGDGRRLALGLSLSKVGLEVWRHVPCYAVEA